MKADCKMIFRIKYQALKGDKSVNGEVRVRNAHTELHAKMKLDSYLLKKGMTNMTIISCEEDIFNSLLDMFTT